MPNILHQVSVPVIDNDSCQVITGKVFGNFLEEPIMYTNVVPVRAFVECVILINFKLLSSHIGCQGF